MGTETRSFGSSAREGHNASAFYARRFTGELKGVSSESLMNWATIRNQIFHKSSEAMIELPSNSVALMITSPPYNVGKEYDNDLSRDEYLGLLFNVFLETYRVLEPGGRACVNVANLGRKPYIPLASYVTELMQEIGFLMRGEIIWKKANGANGSCAWGSFRSAKNPTMRDVHEYILVFSKGRFDRARKGESTISSKDFTRDTLSIWDIRPESAKKVGHPAPFPVALPERLINLYSYKNDLILDPFLGVGTTCVAAKQMGRDYVGYEINEEYCRIANQRLANTPYAAFASAPQVNKSSQDQSRFVTAASIAGVTLRVE
ncbi:MAG: DNA-methyltransferase [Bacteroidota bacterium]